MKKRILFISRTLTGGGAERFVATFSSYLAEKGYFISLLLYEKSENEYPLSDKVSVFVMPQITGRMGKISRIFSMRKIIKKINPDVIIPFIDTVVLCSFIAQYNLTNIFIYTVRNSPWDEKESYKVKILKSIIIKHADYIMLQNEEQAEYFNSYLKNKEIILPNPIAEKFINSPKKYYSDKIRNIIFVGRLEPQKNVSLLLYVFKEILNNNPNLILRVFGEGSEEESLKNIISTLEIENNCLLCGRNNSIEIELCKSDLFILPSNYEGMPNSLIEAMAVGVPCISSDCRTGPKCLIKPYETGLLFHVNDANDLKEKIEWAINNPKKMEIVGRSGRKFICENFTLDKIELKFQDIVK